MMTLLVPLSFTWATVIHRIFDFRVALRAAVAATLLSVIAGAVYVAGELATLLSSDRADYGGFSLAMVGLAASLAGPARPLARALGRSLLPLREERPLSETLSVDALGSGATRGEVLTRATAALTEGLKLDRCLALDVGDADPAQQWGPDGDRPCEPPHLGRVLLASLTGPPSPTSLDEVDLAASDREALRKCGVHWVLPVITKEPAVLLLLGRRLAGPWLDRRETETLVRFARHIALALENVALRHSARTHGELDRELALAGEIQAHLLPRRAPVYPTLDCAAATLSSEQVGGDYYDFVERSSRELTLVVGDAAGKGVPAALRLAGVQARFHTEALRGQEPGPLLRALNLELAYHGHPENFVGLLCARIDVRAGRVHLANAGLEPPLLRRRTGGWEVMDAGGLLLGVRPDAEYPDARIELRAGDLVLIYTDGLTEARRGEEMFGVPRIRAVVDRNAHRRASDIVQALIHEVRSFADQRLDDLTVVTLKQLADPPGVPRRAKSGSSPLEWRPIRLDETAEVVSPARAANPRAADPKG
jgi:serine phosphatase RsbU (regulator of sigma subunit)